MMPSDDHIRHQWDLFAEIWSRDIENDGNRKYILGPASEKMLGDIRGLQVLDLACGEGYFSRLLASAGANVTGVDISKNMIEAARRKEEVSPLDIEYHVGDASDLELESSRFDLVHCSMALMDIIEYEQVIGKVSCVLREGGRFIFSLVHPCFFSSRTFNGKPMCQTERGEPVDGGRSFLYMKIYDYNKRHALSTNWMKDGKPYLPVPLVNFHRTLSDYVNALGRHGLYITRMDEPTPNEEGIKIFNDDKDTRIPNFMIIEAIKNP
jgi:SAM-dependent methyltransferase